MCRALKDMALDWELVGEAVLSATPPKTKKGPEGALDPIGRSGEIRTHDPCLPKTVLYQAELLPVGNESPNIKANRKWQSIRRIASRSAAGT